MDPMSLISLYKHIIIIVNTRACQYFVHFSLLSYLKYQTKQDDENALSPQGYI